MNARLTIWGAVILLLIGYHSGNAQQALTPDVLTHIREIANLQPASRALINAVSRNDIKDLTHTRSPQQEVDHLFAVRIDSKPITNQKSSGRCWLFTSLNILRPQVQEKYALKEFEFSESYIFFYDQLEKANLFLESVIETRNKSLDDRRVSWLFKNPIGDGGVWNMLADLAPKYGLVPSSAMPESHHSENTRMMSTLLKRKLRQSALQLRSRSEKGESVQQLRDYKEKTLGDIYRLLVLHLGEPPQSFTWRYMDKDGNLQPAKTYTPIEFFQQAVAIDFNEYVMLMNDPSRDYYRLYEIDYDRDQIDGRNWTYVNVPVQVMKDFARKSLQNGEAMYFSCDVGKQFDAKEGVLSLESYDYSALYGVDFSMDKRQRILTFDSGSSHAMALVGLDTLANGRTSKWLLENSWGSDRGHQGYLTMTDDWFSEYAFRLVVRRDYTDKPVQQVLEQEPVRLHPWDPMYLPAEDE